MTCEVHVPISPTPGFFTRVHYLAASLRRFGGALSRARLVVTVGDDDTERDLYAANPWSRHYPIEWRWLDRELFSTYHYFATASQRFCYDFTSDIVLLLDADVLVVSSIDDLLARVMGDPALHGVVDYLGPARLGSVVPLGDYWAGLYASAGLPRPRLVCQHDGWGVMRDVRARLPEARYSPPFFNLGFLCAPADVMRRIGAGIFREMAEVDRFQQSVFRCQAGLCLTLERGGIPWRSLAPRFNFPNDPAMTSRFQADFRDVRVIHYFAGGQFVREVDIGSTEGVGRLLQHQSLHPVNARFRDALAQLHDTVVAERGLRNAS